MYKDFICSVRLDEKTYKVIYQNESDYRNGLVDLLTIRLSDNHYVRFIGFNPRNNDYDSRKDFGRLTKGEAEKVKKDFYYASYKLR